MTPKQELALERLVQLLDRPVKIRDSRYDSERSRLANEAQRINRAKKK